MNYLHVLQDEELQDVQPDVEETCFSTPLIPKTENFFFMFFELHLMHLTSGLLPETSSSNSVPQSLHLYSNIGM